MKDFILFMYDDAIDTKQANNAQEWEDYFSKLHSSGQFDGGSSIGRGALFNKNRPDRPSEIAMTGFIRIRAGDMDEAKLFLSGNPIFEAGAPSKSGNCREMNSAMQRPAATTSLVSGRS